MVSSDHSNVDLVSFKLLTSRLELSIPDILNGLVYIFSEWVIHSKSSKVDQIILKLISEVIRFEVIAVHELVEVLDSDLLKGIGEALEALTSHVR